MKLNKRKLRQIIRREIDTMLQEGMLDSVLGSQFNPLRGMVDQRPSPPMVKRGELGRFFKDPKEFFESLKNDYPGYPFIEVNDRFAFVPDWAYDIGPGGMEGGSPGDDISYAIEGMAIKEEHVDFPEPGTRYYFLHQDGQPARDYIDLSGGDGRGGIPRQRSRYNLYENDNSHRRQLRSLIESVLNESSIDAMAILQKVIDIAKGNAIRNYTVSGMAAIGVNAEGEKGVLLHVPDTSRNMRDQGLLFKAFQSEFPGKKVIVYDRLPGSLSTNADADEKRGFTAAAAYHDMNRNAMKVDENQIFRIYDGKQVSPKSYELDPDDPSHDFRVGPTFFIGM